MKISLTLVLAFFSIIIFAQDYEIGQSYFDENEHIEYLHGNLPIIISVPHGGEKEPNNILDRNCQDCIVINDAFTQELSRAIIENIHLKTGCYPHVIMNRLHRSKLDANREIIEATQGNSLAEEAWLFYHETIDFAKDLVTSNYSKGLFIDLHGHAHTNQRLELGYLISKINLMLSDEDLDQNNFEENSSIRSLSEDNLSGSTFSELIRGENSLGEIISNSNFPTVPSIVDPFPMTNEAYFSGGYNTNRHGSRTQGKIDAIQIECNQDVRFDENEREEFAEALADALLDFLERNYFENINSNNCGLLSTEELESIEIKIHPNPIVDYFEIECTKSYDEIIIFNSLGNDIYRSEKSTNSQKVDLSNFPNGLYFIVGKLDQKQIFNKKIFKTN